MENVPQCGRCAKQKRDDTLELWTSICGHDMCRLCKDEIFRNGKFKEECPAVVDPITRRRCGTRLQLKDFDLKIFESGSVHREVHLRKKKLVGFNKALDDFGGDLAVYNDYLEMVEDLSYTLTHGTSEEVDVAEKKIEMYLLENKAVVKARTEQDKRERRARESSLKRERQAAAARRGQAMNRNSAVQAAERRRRQAELQAELFAGARPIADIMMDLTKLRESKAPSEPALVAEKLVATGGGGEAAMVEEGVATEQSPLFVYVPDESMTQTSGPPVPMSPQLRAHPYATVGCGFDADQVVVRAGGYPTEATALRALQDAFSCLYARSH